MTRPVGLALPNNEPGAASAFQWLPEAVEGWGYDSLWVTDHVVGVRAMEGVYGSYWLEALTALTWAAARTSNIRLGTGILVVPHRDPVLTAKMVASLDRLSGGRVDLGIGVGWSRVEFRALGVVDRYEPRGAVTNEALDVMLECWKGGSVSHEGQHFSFRHIDFEPTPEQLPHPPVWVGGDSAPALRRAAKYADVWHPHDLSPAEVSSSGDKLDALAGRNVARSVRISVDEHQVDGISDLVDSYLDIGCTRVVVDFRSLPTDMVAKLAKLAAARLFA